MLRDDLAWGIYVPTGICFKVDVACLLGWVELSPVRLRASRGLSWRLDISLAPDFYLLPKKFP